MKDLVGKGEVVDTGGREEETCGTQVRRAQDQWFTNLAARISIAWRALNRLRPAAQVLM